MQNPNSPYTAFLQPNMGMQPQMGPPMGQLQQRPGGSIRPAPRPQQQQRAPAQGGGGLMGGAMGGMMGGGEAGGMMAGLSDVHSKEQIKKLEGKNEALTAALSTGTGPTHPVQSFQPLGKDGLTDERRSYYAGMGQKAKGTGGPPMSTDLARWASGGMGGGEQSTPTADIVAAQNVGMSGKSAPMPPPSAAPGAAPAPPSAGQPPPQGSPFAFNRGMPDMSALDEAYRRRGTTPGT